MVVQREIILDAVTGVVTSASKNADDNIGTPPLFGPFDLQNLKSKSLCTQKSEIFQKLQDTVKSLSENSPSMRSSLNPASLNLRLRAVTVIKCLHLFFGGTSDVFATSVSILDKFMSLVKIQEKYLSCVAGACYFISSKVYLEEEEIPTASELAYLHGNKWTSSDLCRMETVILKKLQWDVPKINYLTFLRLFVKLLDEENQEKTVCMENQIHLAESLIKLDDSILFKPSTLALCVLNHLLEKQVIDVQTRAVLIQIQMICDIHDSELFECKDLLNQCLNVKNSTSNQPYQKSSINFPFKIRSRPSSEGESELPPITEVTSY